MFTAWMLLNGHAGSIHTREFRRELVELAERRRTPGAWFLEYCDGKLTNENLSDTGNDFTQAYYGSPDEESLSGYLSDYDRCFPALPSLYHVEDSWLSYDRLAPTIERAFKRWRNGGGPWWKKLLQ
jgi:hypothetical protein